MLKILFIVLAIWLVLSLVGFLIKGLLWLGFIALALFVITSVYGFVKRQRLR